MLLGLAYAQLGFKELVAAGGGDSIGGTPTPRLAINVSAASAGAGPDAAEAPRLRLGVGELVGMHLFGGGTEYGTQAEMQELHRLMRRGLRAAEALTEARGRLAMLLRSGLERACEDVL